MARKGGLKGHGFVVPSGFERPRFGSRAATLRLSRNICAYLDSRAGGRECARDYRRRLFRTFLSGLSGGRAAGGVAFSVGVASSWSRSCFSRTRPCHRGGGVFIMPPMLGDDRRYPDPTFSDEPEIAMPRGNYSSLMWLATIGIIVLARYLPRTSLPPLRAHEDNPDRPVTRRSAPESRRRSIWRGKEGAALTTLRARGKDRFGDMRRRREGRESHARKNFTVIKTDWMRVVGSS